jgi:hypothetical protein
LAVQENPYNNWDSERSEADYRSHETQASALTRQMLKQPEFLLLSNRVNPGPLRNLRARAADSATQSPHTTCNEEMWGWQGWTETSQYLTDSDVSNNLLEKSTDKSDIPGCGES